MLVVLYIMLIIYCLWKLMTIIVMRLSKMTCLKYRLNKHFQLKSYESFGVGTPTTFYTKNIMITDKTKKL